jgi:superfamily II DNA or RNA helicase
MLRLEDIRPGAQVSGIDPAGAVEIVACQVVGDSASIFYKDAAGHPQGRMLFRSDEARLALATTDAPWSFTAPGGAFKLGAEALRIQLAHLFDPMMAVHTSSVEPLPHQITAVYESMLPRQPLRFVLADDPGAGKTIMAGLYIRELIMRGDADRVLIVTPGSLVEQWEGELFEKFGLEFEIFSRQMVDTSHTGNPFAEHGRLLARIDQLSRAKDLEEKLKAVHWDLVVVDEAHKMAAHYYGTKIEETKRFELGRILSGTCRSFLLMTATPHNGKDEDFQLFLSLLDADRFYGRFRGGASTVDTTDIMRRMVKEDMLKFDGRPLFPERRAYSPRYTLSPAELELYAQVTAYVRDEMNRAQKLDGKARNSVGFALTLLQRRLASSPEAIFQSIKRRRTRLEARAEDLRTAKPGEIGMAEILADYTLGDEVDPDEDLSGEELEQLGDTMVDQATAARTLRELDAEIASLKALEFQAKQVVASGQDRKWEELSRILQDDPEMKTADGKRRKLIVFSEHRDTLNYLCQRIAGVLGSPDAVVAIHGGIDRDERRRIQERFRHDPVVLVLVATDAAGEGVNLQNANLMVNYDLPWNPNRLEQRFGRIHRIGQTEVCHLWNVVADNTREGEVFKRLFAKLETERQALGGRVFDILGEAFENRSLKDMLIDAIRYGDDPAVRARLDQQVEGALDTAHLRLIMDRNALSEEVMTPERLFAVKEDMERAQARKLQPHFIRAFFLEAFSNLHGILRRREAGRFEITHVPAEIRERDKLISHSREPVLRCYERVCFERSDIRLYGKPMAALIHPGQPLMAAVTDLVLQQHRNTLRQGAVLLDPADAGTEPRLVLLLDHVIREPVYGTDQTRIASRRLQFVTFTRSGQPATAGWAPHLDLVPLSPEELAPVADVLHQSWLASGAEQRALEYAMAHLVPDHYHDVKARRDREVERISAAVYDRLNKEIAFWRDRYLTLKDEVAAGRQPRMQPENARREMETLHARLDVRQKELEVRRQLMAQPPTVLGAMLVIPAGLMAQRTGETPPDTFGADPAARARIEAIAMSAVIDREQAAGRTVHDVSADHCGWDVSSYAAGTPDRHIEVKGRAAGAPVITVTRNEICTALNQADTFILAIVLVAEDNAVNGPHYIRRPFEKEPDWGAASVNYSLADLLKKVER